MSTLLLFYLVRHATASERYVPQPAALLEHGVMRVAPLARLLWVEIEYATYDSQQMSHCLLVTRLSDSLS